MGERDGKAVTAFVAAGSNVDPQSNIPAALDLLRRHVQVTASSTFYQTEPIGPADQPPFVNGVWCIETGLGPRQVKLSVLNDVERRLGRVRTDDRFAPRTIDLDLVLYDSLQFSEPDLVLPHPDIARPFVYAGLMELIEDIYGEQSYKFRRLILRFVPQSGCTRDAGRPLPELTARLRGMLDRV